MRNERFTGVVSVLLDGRTQTHLLRVDSLERLCPLCDGYKETKCMFAPGPCLPAS